jgi:protein-disulfide isomerase
MKRLLGLMILAALTVGCTSKESLKKMLSEDPSILSEAIEKNPSQILESLNKAVRKAQEGEMKKRDEEEKKQLENAYANPLKPTIRNDDPIRGVKGAPLTLVEYSDFQCPYCSRAYGMVTELMEKYKGKIQFIHKHLPLQNHDQAMITAVYFEAIAAQDPEKAYKFHDKIYADQSKLRNGEKYLKEVAKAVGADVDKLDKETKPGSVAFKRVEEDKAEAEKFGFEGTPGFILNGIPVRGAFPIDHFVGIIEELKKRGKVSL